jgi:serine/threonine protein kinase
MQTRALASSPLPGFEIVGRIGAGGMGEILDAVRVGPGGFRKRVAIKQLAVAGVDAGALRRFFQEARIGAGLEHPNVVHVIDFVALDNRYFLVMERLTGCDVHRLAAALEPRGWPVPAILALARQLLDALVYLHELTDEEGVPLGLVHRDVTPGNVFLCRDGVVKVLDFGIAKLVRSPLGVTSVGSVSGTSEFLSPEHARGGIVDTRSDLYQAGATLYRLLSGRTPHGDGPADEVLTRASSRPATPLSELRPDLPLELSALVDRAMAFDPAARFAGARAMRTELERIDGGRSDRALLAAVAARVAPSAGPGALVAAAGDPLVGECCGDFRLVEAIVPGRRYLAEQHALPRAAIVEVANETTDGAAWLQAAAAAARFEHPFVAHVYAVGRNDSGLRWIAREHARGLTLAELIFMRGLALDELVELFGSLCEVLQCAHADELTHGDLRPENVVVLRRGSRVLPKLLGFGAPGRWSGAPADEVAPYLAPERWIDDKGADAASEQYALAAMLHHALAGEPPFGRRRGTELARAHLGVPPPSLPPRVPPPLADAIRRALHKDPARRFAGVAAFAQALRVGEASAPRPRATILDGLRAWLGREPRTVAP